MGSNRVHKYTAQKPRPHQVVLSPSSQESQESWPIKTYDGERIEEYYSRRPWEVPLLRVVLVVYPMLVYWVRCHFWSFRNSSTLYSVSDTPTNTLTKCSTRSDRGEFPVSFGNFPGLSSYPSSIVERLAPCPACPSSMDKCPFCCNDATQVLQRFLRIGPPISAWYAQEQMDKQTAKFLPQVGKSVQSAQKMCTTSPPRSLSKLRTPEDASFMV